MGTIHRLTVDSHAYAVGSGEWRLGVSFALADPERKLGQVYTMNSMGTDPVSDPGNRALIYAIDG